MLATLFEQLPIEVFGSTETGGIAYRQQHSSHELWQLFDGVQAELNQEGCLKLQSPNIAIDPDANNSWYQTADACRFHSATQFELLGRTDRIVKIEEKRISLVEVEQRLEATAMDTRVRGDQLSRAKPLNPCRRISTDCARRR